MVDMQWTIKKYVFGHSGDRMGISDIMGFIGGKNGVILCGKPHAIVTIPSPVLTGMIYINDRILWLTLSERDGLLLGVPL